MMSYARRCNSSTTKWDNFECLGMKNFQKKPTENLSPNIFECHRQEESKKMSIDVMPKYFANIEWWCCCFRCPINHTKISNMSFYKLIINTNKYRLKFVEDENWILGLQTLHGTGFVIGDEISLAFLFLPRCRQGTCVRVANKNTERKLKKDRERAKEHVRSNYAMLLLNAIRRQHITKICSWLSAPRVYWVCVCALFLFYLFHISMDCCVSLGFNRLCTCVCVRVCRSRTMVPAEAPSYLHLYVCVYVCTSSINVCVDA